MTLAIWTKCKNYKLNGLYVELAFLDVFLHNGQAIIIFICFITDFSYVLNAIIKRWRILRYGDDTFKIPELSELDLETTFLCDRFKTHHFQKCKKEIAKNKRWRAQEFFSVFHGFELVDWLLDMGLVQNREDAVTFGRKLIRGRLMKHYKEYCDFEDSKLLYKFVNI